MKGKEDSLFRIERSFRQLRKNERRTGGGGWSGGAVRPCVVSMRGLANAKRRTCRLNLERVLGSFWENTEE